MDATQSAGMIERPGAPADLGDGWTVAPPAETGLDCGLLAGLADQFEAWPDANLHAVLIAHRGRLVYERYFTGPDWAWATRLDSVAFEAGTSHDVRSITKSVVGLLVGIARDRGWIGDLDAPVLSFFPEHADLRTGEKDRITLRHLLTMSAGFAWNEDLPYSDPANSERQMIDAPDQLRYVLERPLDRPPGASHRYNGGQTALIGGILERVAGRPVDSIARSELFDPLGIGDVEWMRYADGTPMAPSGLRMRPRDLAKVGQLVLDRGVWHGRRIVSADWIDESLAPQQNGQSLYFYGYHWWLGRSLVERREVKWAAAFGWGGQRLYVVPACALVVLVHAGLYDNPPLQPIVPEIVLRRYALASVKEFAGAAENGRKG